MPYFKEIFDYARTLDPQHRPLTYTNLLMAAGGKDKCHQFADVICLNRYYGWYVQDGYQLIGAKKAFINEMNQWMNTEPNKPFLFTEYGADTDAGVHKLPSMQWSEEYQCEYLTMQHEVFDMFEAVVGEQVWNLCDFQTGEGIMRVDGNKKDVFTRDRQPKAAAYVLKERWETKYRPAPGIFQEQHTSHNTQRNIQKRTS
ncbi:glycoside hydrolase family 2 TIM barrel-domain containing protein [Bifidobacterium longum]|nr:glycoside hydrolase family 2 TIM barrel-domain containing protein [Bifidobacterium longum]TCE75470.1 beta-galactosidase [Bifidobacterium longum subsp. longum]